MWFKCSEKDKKLSCSVWVLLLKIELSGKKLEKMLCASLRFPFNLASYPEIWKACLNV